MRFPHFRVFRPLKKVTSDVIGYSAAIHACSLVCGPWPGPGAEKTCDQQSRVPGLPGLSWVRPVKSSWTDRDSQAIKGDPKSGVAMLPDASMAR